MTQAGTAKANAGPSGVRQTVGEGFPVVVARVRRSARVSVLVKLTMYQGRPLLEMRNYWHKREGGWRATRKGLSLGIKHLPKLAQALVQAEAKARSLGLLPDKDGG